MDKNNDKTNYENVLVEDIMATAFKSYAKYVIQDRAIPSINDGLKPVQRRILYAMNKEGNTHTHSFRKSVKTVGLVIGNYHPHGDSSVYEAMVRLSQDWKVSIPLIEIHGNNGSIDDDPAAAMRYTEARLSSLADEMLSEINEDCVPFQLNFDDTEQEPVFLPSKFCNLLVNGATGISTGYATDIPPHNFNEVMEATIYRLENPKSDLRDVMQYIKAPDFPTGGVIQGTEGILDTYQKGKGKIVVRGKVELIPYTTKTKVQQIVITEIPFEVVKSNLVKRIDDFRLSNNIDAISDVRDESDRTGLRIVVDVKKDADLNLILNLLYKNTDLQKNYNANIVAIQDKAPKQLGLLTILDSFIAFRKQVVLDRCQYRLDKALARQHILEGLIKAVSILDEVIKVIRGSQNKGNARENLIKTFNFSQEQAEAILIMQLHKLSNTDILDLESESTSLLKTIKYLQGIIGSAAKLKNLLKSEFLELNSKYTTPRRTQIFSEEAKPIEIDKLALLNDEPCMVLVTRDGYIKRLSLRAYGSSNTQEFMLKEGDKVVNCVETSTLHTLLAITKQGNYITVPIHKVQEVKWKSLGNHLSMYSKLEGNDKIVSFFTVDTTKVSNDTSLLIATKQGNIKRTPLIDYVQSIRVTVSTAIKLKSKTEDEVVSAHIVTNDDRLLVVSKQGLSYSMDIDNIPTQSIRAIGVKAMNLATSDYLLQTVTFNSSDIDNLSLVVINDFNDTKRINLKDIPLLNRSSKGNQLAKKIKSKLLTINQIVLVSKSMKELGFIGYDTNTLEMVDISSIPYISTDKTYSSIVTIENKYLMHS